MKNNIYRLPLRTTILHRSAIALIMCLSVYTNLAFGQGDWEVLSNTPVTHHPFEFISVHPNHPETVFLGSGGSVYRSDDGGSQWKQTFWLGPNSKVNRVYFDRDRIFLLSSSGVYESLDGGRRWKQTFRGHGKKRTDALSLVRDPDNPDTLYLGTEGGYLSSRDNGKNWQAETELGQSGIRSLALDKESRELFIASDKGLYRKWLDRNRLDRVYVTKKQGQEDLDEISEVGTEADEEISIRRNNIQTLLVASHPAPVVAIGTAQGVFVSEDEGNHWERLPLNGLQSTNILDLAYSTRRNTFITGTDRGVYIYDESRKQRKEAASGLPAVKTWRLYLADSGETETIFAVTSKGIVRIIFTDELRPLEPVGVISPHQLGLFSQLIQEEPTIQKIQSAALRYANVGNWKIKRWQWASRLRAAIPSFSIGKDFSRASNIDLDRGSTSEPDLYIIGPPQKSEGWGMDVNWDLGDFIWNSAQTSIDSREKLMVELRGDILSEVTRLYFERRRAQGEFIFSPSEDIEERLNQLIRIDELTANIDALTDGFLSKELSQLYHRSPQLRGLWTLPST